MYKRQVLHIVIGLVIGVAAFFFLVLPANEKALNEKHNQEMIPYLQKLNNASQQYETSLLYTSRCV